MLVENVLCAFYAPHGSVDEGALDAFVRKHLPYYSVPDKWFQVDSIPLTNNGKVDRRKLSSMALHQSRPNSTVFEPTEKPGPISHGVVLELGTPSMSSTHSLKDPEKANIIVTSSLSDQSDLSIKESSEKVPEFLPPKNSFHGLRWLRHRGFILYRRFFSIVVLANMAVAAFLLNRKIGENRDILSNLALATAANLVVAVLMRSEPVVNLLFTVFCSVPVRNDRLRRADGLITNCALPPVDLFPSSYTPSLREDLPHWRYTQWMCASSYDVALHLHRGQQPGPRKACTSASNLGSSCRFIVSRAPRFAGHRCNFSPDFPLQIPQRLGDDASLRWLDLSCAVMGPNVSRDQRSQSVGGPINRLFTCPIRLASCGCDSGYHLSMAVSTQSRSPLRGSLQPRRSTLVRLHDTRGGHRCKTCRASLGRLVS